MKVATTTALSFDDVLIIPKYNTIASRSFVDTSTKISKHLHLKIPLISSCMDTVTESKMAIAMWKAGGLGILHRYNAIPQQCDMFMAVKAADADCAVAVGITRDYKDRIAALIKTGVSVFCFDVAHGDCLLMVDAIKWFRNSFGKDFTVIAGNVATSSGLNRLVDTGADAVRVGIGGGSLCSTRLVTGHGIPTFQSVFDCAFSSFGSACIIADGGIKNSGDIVKSLAAGASAVMLGQLLSATDEAPGEIIKINDILYKKYRGMASRFAQEDWKPEKKNEIVPEGEETLMPYKGSVDKTLYQLVGGLRSGMTYSGVASLSELAILTDFIQITSSGWAESRPHAKIG